MRTRLRRLWLLLAHPGQWSAEHYQRKNRMDFAALRGHELGRDRP